MTWRIDISIGPVQGFVAQSRRTRDLWGSSYLLSYLCAHAMHGAVAAGARIVRPDVTDDALFKWVGVGGATPPRIGSVPNHFEVASDVAPEVVVASVTSAFQTAWRKVYQAVWDYYLQPVHQLGLGTRKIWQRQVDSFWEIVWVAAEGSADGLLARRKHWRTHPLPQEPGDKCTVMPDFQELSGHVRGARGREAQKAFWDAIRARVGTLELKEEESLCALAFIKRFFAKISEETIGGALDVDHWPSTLYVGAVPWLQQVRERAIAQAEEYVAQLRRVAEPGTFRNHVPLAEFERTEPAKFFKLDANYYHPGFLANARRAPLRSDGDALRPKLVEQLREINQAAESSPPVYFAFLLADGDQLGKQIAAAGGEAGKVSQALSAFGKKVDGIVSKHHGVTVYAGGDDVLAMLPVPGALPCADELARKYTCIFKAEGLPTATLSAAVVFAHGRMPAGGVLAHARDLLDNVAKDGNGRNSLAVSVLKPGGLHCQWVTTWDRRYPDRKKRAVERLTKLAQAMAPEEGGRDFSSSLLHQTRDTLSLLCDSSDWSPGQLAKLPEGLNLEAYVRAEVVDSWESRAGRDPESAEVDQVTALVVDLLSPAVNQTSEQGTGPLVDTGQAGVDALLLARFIAGGGREEDHG